MSSAIRTFAYVAVMAAVLFAVDYAFLRGQFWLRLVVNVLIVFAAGFIYLIFLKPS